MTSVEVGRNDRDGAVEPGAPRDDRRRQEAQRADDRADDHEPGERGPAHVRQGEHDRDERAERERGADDRLGNDRADRGDLRGDRDAGREVSLGLAFPVRASTSRNSAKPAATMPTDASVSPPTAEPTSAQKTPTGMTIMPKMRRVRRSESVFP